MGEKLKDRSKKILIGVAKQIRDKERRLREMKRKLLKEQQQIVRDFD